MTGTARAYTQADIETALRESRSWRILARPDQREPLGDWLIWLIITGRGWGKTRTAGETITNWAQSGRCKRIHLVARTAGDARDTMVEGESGLLRVGDARGFRPLYEPSKRRLTWPNGAQATLFTADEPDVLRGPQNDGWWADEVASWKYGQETWDMLQMCSRLGPRVRGIVTTTPRPIKLLKEILARPSTHTTRGHTMDNAANLAPSFLESIKERYEGTRLGRQELAGEILDDNPSALWKRAQIDADRLTALPAGVTLVRVVVALDPSCTDTGDEAGIVVCGKGSDGIYYLLEDCTLQASPDAWARTAVAAYHRHKADRIVYETNQGGQMVTLTLATIDRTVPTRGIHASRGKVTRAEPVAALAEQHRVKHVGMFPALEDQLCNYDGSPGQASPNNLDAYVYALTELHQKSPVAAVVGHR
jgi:predicted phage terminase large subunit-like protein